MAQKEITNLHVPALLALLGWLWREIKLRIEKENKKIMVNFISGLLLAESEAVKLSEFLAKLPTYLPLIQKNIADLQKAATDKSDPTALMGDVSTLLGDLNSDLATLSAVIPSLKPTTVPVVTPPSA